MKNKIKISISAFLLTCLALTTIWAQVSTPIKWVTIGNSITFGTGTTPGTVNGGAVSYTNGYPYRLAARLGPAFSIENDGINSMEALKSGNHPYWTQARLPQAFAFQPDIVSMTLGTNDSKPINWRDSVHFVMDYGALVDTLMGMASHPQVWPVFPTWCGQTETMPINWTDTSTHYETTIRYSIIPKIDSIAKAKGLNTVDLHTPTLNKNSLYISDLVHPNNAGADTLAANIYRTFLSKVTRVAVVGNGITSYVGTISGAAAVDANPIKLNMLLGRSYYVRNLGVASACALKPASGLTSYWSQTTKFDSLFAYNPNIIIINLGTDDARPKSWNTAKFIADYEALIDTFSNKITPKPQIWLARPAPVWQVNGAWPSSTPSGSTDNGIDGNTLRDSVLPAISRIAGDKSLNTIDVYSAFTTNTYQTDGVNINAAGQDTLAHILFRGLSNPPTAIYSSSQKVHLSSPDVRYISMDHKAIPKEVLGNTKVYMLDGKTASQDGTPTASGVYVTKPVPADEKKKVEEK